MSSQGWEPSQAAATQDSLAPGRLECARLFSVLSGGQQRPMSSGETEEKADKQTPAGAAQGGPSSERSAGPGGAAGRLREVTRSAGARGQTAACCRLS